MVGVLYEVKLAGTTLMESAVCTMVTPETILYRQVSSLSQRIVSIEVHGERNGQFVLKQLIFHLKKLMVEVERELSP